MNIITYDYACCLYPDLTFLDRLSLLNFPISQEEGLKAIEKYTARGFTFIKSIDDDMLNDPDHSLYPGIRAFGDKKCWNVKLYPKQNNDPIGDLNLNSWLQEYNPDLTPRFSFSFYFLTTLDRYYLSSGLTSKALLERLHINLTGILEMTMCVFRLISAYILKH